MTNSNQIKKLVTIRLANAALFLYFLNFSVYADSEMDEMLNMSLEDLMEMKVSIATRSEKSLSTTAAPVFVISADDIRRSGAANIPESLRMAPGVQVTQANPHDWNVSIRGLNDQAANRFLVLVDGRSVSGGLSTGTYWRDLQSIPMETIERIEIIRGSGATIWGVNSTNGVINVITRSALTTKGAQLTAGGGTAQQGFGRFDYTKKVSDNASVRGYGTYFNVADAKGDNNFEGQAGSGWTGGARFDLDNKNGDIVMADASWIESDSEESGSLTMLKKPFTKFINSEPYKHQSGHFLTRWEHHINEKNYWAIRSFYEHVDRNDFPLHTKFDVFDVDFTHYFSLNDQHNLTSGMGYRRTNDDTEGSQTLTLNPASTGNDIYNAFIQDEIALDENKRWLLTLGSRFEYYSLTGFEAEPSGSLSWHINDKHTLWTSVSRAIRVPSRGQTSDSSYLIYNSSRYVGGSEIPVMVQGKGKAGINAENVTTYQMGWRGAFSEDLTADATVFYSNYNDLVNSVVIGSPALNNSLGIPSIISSWQAENSSYAQSFGTEFSLNWQTTKWWRNYLSYSFISVNTQPYAGKKLDFYDGNRIEKSTPEHQVSLRTNFNVTQDIDFDIWWRYTDSTLTNKRLIDDYFNTDVRVAWRPVKSLELSLIGQNLIQTQHIEYQGDFLQPQMTYVPRGVYAKFNWQF